MNLCDEDIRTVRKVQRDMAIAGSMSMLLCLLLGVLVIRRLLFHVQFGKNNRQRVVFHALLLPPLAFEILVSLYFFSASIDYCWYKTHWIPAWIATLFGQTLQFNVLVYVLTQWSTLLSAASNMHDKKWRLRDRSVYLLYTLSGIEVCIAFFNVVYLIFFSTLTQHQYEQSKLYGITINTLMASSFCFTISFFLYGMIIHKRLQRQEQELPMHHKAIMKRARTSLLLVLLALCCSELNRLIVGVPMLITGHQDNIWIHLPHYLCRSIWNYIPLLGTYLCFLYLYRKPLSPYQPQLSSVLSTTYIRDNTK